MFVGHLAAALTGRTVTRGTSLVWFVAAANLVDLIWPLLLIAGIERVRIDPGNTAFTPLAFESYPWTHSLLMGVVWGIALAALSRQCGAPPSAARRIGARVGSHWVLADHGLTAWPKTSGSRGFHIYARIHPRWPFKQVSDLLFRPCLRPSSSGMTISST